MPRADANLHTMNVTQQPVHTGWQTCCAMAIVIAGQCCRVSTTSSRIWINDVSISWNRYVQLLNTCASGVLRQLLCEVKQYSPNSFTLGS